MIINVVRGSSTYIDYTTDSAVTSSLNNNQWNHIVISVNDNGSTRIPIFYINGTAVAGTTSSSNSDDISSIDFGDVAIGGVQTFNLGSDVYDAIEMDEIALFNVKLSASNVTEIYNGGVPADETERNGLIGYWRLEDNGDDSSTNNNPLTVTGATYTSDVPS